MKFSGEAIPDLNTGKWGYIIYDENNKVHVEPEYKFNSQHDAEIELVQFLEKFKEEVDK